MKKAVFLLLTLFLNVTNLFSQAHALDFDGNDDLVITNYNGISGTAARTVEAWINTTQVTNGATQMIIVDWGSTNTGERFTLNMHQNNALRIEVGGNGFYGTTALNDGLWHHVAVVYDPSQTNDFTLYVDGNFEIAGNVTVTVNTNNAATPLRIGRRIDNVNAFNGMIDEVRIWDKARTQSEIQSDMNFELCAPVPNLVAYFNFQDGVASPGGNNTGVTTTNDFSGNAYIGTLTNFSLSGTSSNWVNGASLAAASTFSTINDTICQGATYAFGNQTIDSAGSYQLVIPNSQGCDSTIYLDLAITTVDTSISTLIPGTLTALANNATYQWYDCNAGMVIPGENSDSYTPSQGGDYAVIVTQNGCSDTSACYNMNIGLNENGFSDLVDLYPNPSNGVFKIKTPAPISNLEILNPAGELIAEINSRNTLEVDLNSQNLSSGLYFVKISIENEWIIKKLLIEK